MGREGNQINHHLKKRTLIGSLTGSSCTSPSRQPSLESLLIASVFEAVRSHRIGLRSTFEVSQTQPFPPLLALHSSPVLRPVQSHLRPVQSSPVLCPVQSASSPAQYATSPVQSRPVQCCVQSSPVQSVQSSPVHVHVQSGAVQDVDCAASSPVHSQSIPVQCYLQCSPVSRPVQTSATSSPVQSSPL